jgi:hypothetical protein
MPQSSGCGFGGVWRLRKSFDMMMDLDSADEGILG